MTSQRWQRIKAIVSEASSADPAGRANIVARACAGDADMEREVSSLLESLARLGDRFDAPLVGIAGAGSVLQAVVRGDALDVAAAAIGRRIGPYEVRRELGRGGMGAVYLATRVDEEYTQDVALKIIKRGMDTDAIVRRFRNERQILAGLSHAHIARLLDGGTTADGLPYLVMEYVDGEAITTHCDRRALGIDARLALFRDVCAGVAYAHQHLVVHRDIKPSNVLVAADGRAKLLDFGLATILSGDDRRHETQTANGWLTPDFASPEQVLGAPVTTATDVYSLGILLFELLCGARPFVRRGDRDWRSAVGHEPLQKPSAMLSDAAAAVRGAKPERLRRALRGDLDTIALKALHTDPARRYATAQELSDDVHRHLMQLPVAAQRDTIRYVAARFVRRHTAATVASALVVATLAAATAITTAQARVARRERAQAERRLKDVRQLANAFLFDFHDAIASLPGSTAARAMVLATAQRYLDSLAQEAGADRELSFELSTSYLKLGDVEGRPSASRIGDTDGALRNYERALDLRRRLAAADPGNAGYQHSVAGVLVRMGPIFQVRGDPRTAAERTREAMALMDRLAERAPTADVRRDAFRAPFYLGDALLDQGDYDGALAMYGKALAIAETARHDPPEADFRHRLAVVSERLGIMWGIKGEFGRAIDSFRDALANEEAMRASEPDNAAYAQLIANARYHIGDALLGQKKPREALAEQARALALYEDLARADPRDAGSRKDIGGCTQKMAEALLAAGDARAAAPTIARTIAIRRELADRDTGSIEYRDDYADALTLDGEIRLAGGDTAGAIRALDAARAIREPIVASRPQQVVYARGLARLYATLGRAHAQAARGAARPEEERGESLRWHQAALALWTDLERRHALWFDEREKPAETRRLIASLQRR
ncbi:MAG TPA: protein kinase [Vicinamibacterales bacterium]|nr:protein kinase [Vicinamibacterales bacterium]